MRALLFVLMFICISTPIGAETISDIPDSQLSTFLWDSRPSSAMTDEYIQDAIDRKDPHQIFYRIFRAVRHGARHDPAQLEMALAHLDYMLDEYQPARRDPDGGIMWRYGYPFHSIDSGWWSGMDGLQAPLTLYMAWEITKKQKYRDVAIASLKLVLDSPENGGVVWRNDKGCWMSEYSWPSIKPSEEYGVLNGHLYAVHALYILSQRINLPEVTQAYECALEGTKSTSSDYHRGDQFWTYYQTKPFVISPINYLLFEVAEFDSLAKITGEEFYAKEAAYRRGLFARQYPVQIKSMSNKVSVVVSAIGAPHPYLPDGYAFELQCSVNGEIISGKHASHYFTNLPLEERLSFSMDLPQHPQECIYSVIRGDFKFYLFTQREFEEPEGSYEEFDIAAEPALDAVAYSDGEVSISPSFESKPSEDFYLNQEGRLFFRLGTEWSTNTILALIVNPQKNTPISFYALDGAGEAAGRVYPEMKANCDNVILLNKIGFKNAEKLTNTLATLVMRLHTKQEDEDYKIQIKSISKLENAIQTRLFLEKHPDVCYRSKTLIDD
ncbi:D-glucuronyl C5-epimerase family protein [Allopusillimonas ginsengisoli]|uniref:D-glucuronyl C5-epimerase family protein n=1 Tax=Allopusillimonas ginsengisoli TaxID=453575 RepID=UPI001021A391|nr:D-glucuronyl C5-epimerase family protein [Allopusillimonas ginsengisoli]TEA77863.1 hypothetical protein ERE07_12655 [Allopusillimonas ginsengisoli]